MLANLPVTALNRQAQDAAARAAESAAVTVVDEFDMLRLRAVADLLGTIWGPSDHGAPIPADLLRSISHAGCTVTAAYDKGGQVCGAAAAIVSPDKPSMYSLIAGVRPGLTDSGVGFALKQHQRAWALARSIDTMTWTFDPLVSRNARFNLGKLGATASEYLPNFYGEMDDAINGLDDSDRLVAHWSLTSPRTIAASHNEPESALMPDFTVTDVQRTGPDKEPALVAAGDSLWCRVPRDIVALRAEKPAEAVAWRRSIRDIFGTALADGYIARGMTRTGWYRLSKGENV
ncbi:hypothetical protein [Cryobacterium sp. PH31-O1]|uniref:hypothetical protein n=1 Tax=Cryobacterium sp. PH31-O1 TaxID=3046306 RepID=UPI0024B9E073|nr:hypothetical protein [Cryobacterium sp. PH31-O1]MDJ0338057.1 hypothetical protein [Cryobacterium sp. PH31-O1]